jgi:hypothetical protein
LQICKTENILKIYLKSFANKAIRRKKNVLETNLKSFLAEEQKENIFKNQFEIIPRQRKEQNLVSDTDEACKTIEKMVRQEKCGEIVKSFHPTISENQMKQ